MRSVLWRMSGGVTAVAVVLAIAACGSDGDSGATSSGGGAATDGNATAAESDLSGKKVFLVSCTNQVPYCARFNRDVTKNLEQSGADVTVQLSNYNPADQVASLNQAVAEKADLVALLPFNQAAIRGGLAKAKQAGVPVFSMFETPEDSVKGLVTSLSVDAPARGKWMATELQTRLVQGGREGRQRGLCRRQRGPAQPQGDNGRLRAPVGQDARIQARVHGRYQL